MRCLISPLLRAARSLNPANLRGSAPAAAGLAAAGLGIGFGAALLSPAALAQRVVPKISTICPLGYVDTLNGKCSTLGLAYYTLRPTNGQACPSGWMNVGGGYCSKK
ncbi:MAG: hypothetical protein RLZZ263_609 [Cyanobacteriota bacterium]